MAVFDCATGEMLPDPVTPPPTLAKLKAAAWERVKAIRDVKEYGGADTPIGRVDTDEVSRARITALVSGATIAISRGISFAARFKRADNQVVDLDAEGVIAMGTAALAYVGAVFERSFDFDDAIRAAADEAELAAIDVEADWP